MTDRPNASDPPDTPSPPVDYDAVGESRWPMAIAVFAVMVLGSVPPTKFTIGPIPIFPVVVAVLLAVLVLGDPGRIDRRARWLRNVSVALVGVLVLGAVGGTVVLVVDLVNGSPTVSQAGPLLVYGAKVWLANNVAFALLFWPFQPPDGSDGHGTPGRGTSRPCRWLLHPPGASGRGAWPVLRQARAVTRRPGQRTTERPTEDVSGWPWTPFQPPGVGALSHLAAGGPWETCRHPAAGRLTRPGSVRLRPAKGSGNDPFHGRARTSQRAMMAA